MNDIFYVPAVGASVIVGLVLWRAAGRYYQSPIKKGLATAGAILLGFVIYLVLAVILVITGAVIHPEHAHETGLALGHGFKILSAMIMVVAATVLAVRGRSTAN